MSRKKQYYNIKPLLQHPANYYILLGMRANGKSYQVKLTALETPIKLVASLFIFAVSVRI